MTAVTEARQDRQLSPRLVSAGLGLLMLGAASALAWYAAYGDQHPKQDQKDAVPSIIVMAAIAAVVVFGVLVPMALRSVRERRDRATTWALALGVAAFLTIVAFWSGIPLIVGAAGAWVAWEGRDLAVRRSAPTKAYTTGLTLSGIAVVLPVVWVVLNNTVV